MDQKQRRENIKLSLNPNSSILHEHLQFLHHIYWLVFTELNFPLYKQDSFLFFNIKSKSTWPYSVVESSLSAVLLEYKVNHHRLTKSLSFITIPHYCAEPTAFNQHRYNELGSFSVGWSHHWPPACKVINNLQSCFQHNVQAWHRLTVINAH